MVIKLRVGQYGGHVGCDVFTGNQAAALQGALAHAGRLIFSDYEQWTQFCAVVTIGTDDTDGVHSLYVEGEEALSRG